MYRKWSLFTMPPVVLGGVFVVCAIPAYLLGGQRKLKVPPIVQKLRWCHRRVMEIGISGMRRARFNEKLIREGEWLRQLDRARITKEKQTAHA
ncbi:hypothetical protein QJS10_CPA03g00210 [Acorus calamus]|uniref:Uncharacterized protein n=1 Tax=Acorus calamus TaxID=4465 RepID=A0AAV9F7S9_ACOCL|nr:hypothetical protein QJS10_CPA03g00210 [Acorus calamus]